MSSEHDALPPQSAPLSERLAAAMGLSAKYRSQRALAKALETDGSLVGKWLDGKVKRITSPQHLRRLPELLETPPGYFNSPVTPDRVDFLAEQVGAMRSLLVSMADEEGVEVPDVLRRGEERAS